MEIDIKKEAPSKVIVIPRPPRSATPELIPIDNPNAPEQTVNQAAPQDAPVAPVAPVNPGSGPLNNQVEGPADGLAGVPTE